MNRIPQWMQNVGNYLPSATPIKNLYNGFLSLPQKQKIGSVFALLGLTLLAAGTAYYFRGRTITPHKPSTPPTQGNPPSEDKGSNPPVQVPVTSLQGSAASSASQDTRKRATPKQLFLAEQAAADSAAQPQETVLLSESPVEGSPTSNPDDDQTGWTTVPPLKKPRSQRQSMEQVRALPDAASATGPISISAAPQSNKPSTSKKSMPNKKAAANQAAARPTPAPAPVVTSTTTATMTLVPKSSAQNDDLDAILSPKEQTAAKEKMEGHQSSLPLATDDDVDNLLASTATLVASGKDESKQIASINNEAPRESVALRADELAKLLEEV